MQLVIPRPMQLGLNTPLELQNNAAWYSLRGSASDSTYLIDGSNRLMLVADRSGNSGTNGLVINGVSGNYASAPDSPTLSITGDIDVRVWAAANDWTPAADQRLLQKYSSSSNGGYGLSITATTGVLEFFWSDNVTTFSKASTVAPTVSDFGSLWVRATLDVDNGAGGNTVTFYTSADGITWSQLGAAVTTAGTTVIDDGTQVLAIGSNSAGTGNRFIGTIYRAQIYNGIAGTLAFDANFTLPAKLASSFTESSANAATVTVNTSGDLGARISGARDLVQLTQANQPIFSTSGGYNIGTGDGTNDYLKAAAFSMVQPASVYFTGSQVTWTINDILFDGGSVDTMGLQTRTATPEVRHQANATFGNALTSWAVGERAVLSAIYSGAASTLRKNLGASVAGSSGVAASNGFTLMAVGSGGIAWANATFAEVIVRSVADDTAMQNRIAAYLMRNWGIS